MGPRQPDLPRRIRRPADEPARERRGDDWYRHWRAYGHLSGRHGFHGSDGQKDIVAFFTEGTGHNKSKVQAAFRFDWYGKDPNGSLEQNFFGGGRVRITRLVMARKPAGTTIAGSRAISWTGKWCRWASFLSIPASYPATPFET